MGQSCFKTQKWINANCHANSKGKNPHDHIDWGINVFWENFTPTHAKTSQQSRNRNFNMIKKNIHKTTVAHIVFNVADWIFIHKSQISVSTFTSLIQHKGVPLWTIKQAKKRKGVWKKKIRFPFMTRVRWRMLRYTIKNNS